MTNWPIASSLWTRLPARRAIPRKEELIEGAVKRRGRIANKYFMVNNIRKKKIPEKFHILLYFFAITGIRTDVPA